MRYYMPDFMPQGLLGAALGVFFFAWAHTMSVPDVVVRPKSYIEGRNGNPGHLYVASGH